MSSVGAEMNIGELARRSGVPSTALRYYEKAGLLPESRRTSSGYRAFQPDTPASPGVHPGSAGRWPYPRRDPRSHQYPRCWRSAMCSRARVDRASPQRGAFADSRAPATRTRLGAPRLSACRRRSLAVRSRGRLQGHPIRCRAGTPDAAGSSLRPIAAGANASTLASRPLSAGRQVLSSQAQRLWVRITAGAASAANNCRSVT
jgi:hypothetical protein